MVKKIIIRFLAALCFCGLIVTQYASYGPVLAVEQGDIDNAKDDIAKKEQEIKDLQNKLDALSKDIASTQAYIKELDTMMAKLTLDVRNWQAKIDAKQAEIDAKVVEIEQKQIQINNTQIELDEESQEEYRSKYPSLRDCVFFSIECRENNELYNRFASYSESLVLVEPQYMRQRLQQKLVSAAANYNID